MGMKWKCEGLGGFSSTAENPRRGRERYAHTMSTILFCRVEVRDAASQLREYAMNTNLLSEIT